MSNHQERKEEVVRKLEARRDSYGHVLVRSALVRSGSVWETIVTIIVPLHKSASYNPKKKFDYGDFVLFEELISLDSLIETVQKLPEKESISINLGDYEIAVGGEYFENSHRYDSGDEFLNVGWYFERYKYRISSRRGSPKEPIVSKNLPLFPDFRDAINNYMDIDISRYSDLLGISICLPKYGARIEEVNIGSREVKLRIQPKDTSAKDIIGKLFCKQGEEVKLANIEFEGTTGIASIGFMPDSIHLALVSKANNEILDARRYYSSWGHKPKGVVVDIPEYEIVELIRRGEMETVEFKEDIGKPEEFAETIVAFANGEGGVILIGVDDRAKIVGLAKRDFEDTITNIVRSHCEPQIKYDIDKRRLEEKEILVLHVEEGTDKPYFVKNRGPYVRANATDRIATRYEMDELYAKSQSGY